MRELEKKDTPKFHLQHHQYFEKKMFLVVNRSNVALIKEDAIYREFVIAQGHFHDHPVDNFLSDDLTWGFARNVLFTVSGYCEKYPYADEHRKYDLVCKIEAIL